MSAIVTSADGAYIFLALEDSGTGSQLVLMRERDAPGVWTAVYAPGGGSACNLAPVPGNADQVVFYGNFGTDVTIIRYTISTDTAEDISPASLGAKIVNCLVVNPGDPDEIWATVDTDQDLLHTVDGGANWETLDAALGFDATALYALWSGAYEFDRGFLAGNDGAVVLIYTPNAGASNYDYTGAALAAAANVVSIDLTEALA
jgi:hypothetical protein